MLKNNKHFDILGFISATICGLYIASACLFNNLEGFSIISRGIGLLVLIMLVIKLAFKPSIRINPMLNGYYLFVLWAVITFPLSSYPVISFNYLFTQIQLLLLTLSINQLIISEKQIHIVLNIFLFSTYVALALNYSDFISAIKFNLTATRPIRFAGTFGNSNGIALYSMLVSFSVIITYFLSKKSIIQYFHLIASFAISTGFIIQSGSRKGMLGFILIFFILGFSIYKRYKYIKWLRFVLIFIPILMTGFAVNYFINSVFYSRFELMMTGEESSLLERLYLIQSAFEVWTSSVSNFIFGIGYGQFIFYNKLGLISHNSFSETTVTTGIIGFILYFSMYIGFTIFILKLYKIKGAGINFALKRNVLLFIIITYLFFEVSAIIFRSRYMLPYLGLISSYIMVLLSNNKLKQSNRQNENSVFHR